MKEKGKTLRYYRHTQLRTGPTEEYRLRLDAFLKGRGYSVAPVTIDNNEYIFAAVYTRAKAKGDRRLQERIANSYIAYLTAVVEHFEKLGRTFLGYEPRQVLLLHVNEINPDHFDRVVRMLKRRGYSFITLDSALEDRAYKLREIYSRSGLSWIHRWMLAKNLKIRPEPPEPK